MTTDPQRVTCEGCGLTLTTHNDAATRAGEFDAESNWTCNVCLAGGLEAVLNQLPARKEPSS